MDTPVFSVIYAFSFILVFIIIFINSDSFFSILEQSQQMPPRQADAQPDDNIGRCDDEADFPPGPLRDVASAVKDWCRTATVMRQRRHEVGESTEDNRGQHGRSANGYGNSEKSCVHRTDMRGDAGKCIIYMGDYSSPGSADCERTAVRVDSQQCASPANY